MKKKTLRLMAILMLAIMAFSVCAFAMGPPPGGGPPPDGGGAPADAGAPAADAGAPAGPATGGNNIAYALFTVCLLGVAVSTPVLVKKLQK